MRYVKVNVRGRVQGVYFRKATREVAMKYDITGWVKNMPDGSVQMEAQGKEADIADFLAVIEKGPSESSNVQEMNVTELEEEARFTVFEIRYS